jgi:transposase-like protein
MKKTNYKQKLYDKEMRRMKRISKATPEQNEIAARNLISRSKRKSEIKSALIRILSTKENLAIADIQRELGINRNTFNYWIDKFEKENLIKRKTIKCEGKEKRGSPKTLVLNKKLIQERKEYLDKSWQSFEERNLNSIVTQKILEEIEKQPSGKQRQKLIELFKEFKHDNFGGKLIFLMSNYIELNYSFSLTDKGKKALKKIKSSPRK